MQIKNLQHFLFGYFFFFKRKSNIIRTHASSYGQRDSCGGAVITVDIFGYIDELILTGEIFTGGKGILTLSRVIEVKNTHFGVFNDLDNNLIAVGVLARQRVRV